MKTSSINLASAGLCACLALALVAAVPVKSFAQEKAGEQMLKSTSPNVGKLIETSADLEGLKKGDMIVMSCPKCKDVMVTTVTGVQKGYYKETKTSAQHLCPGCKMGSELVGQGKDKTWKVTHTCTKCGSTDAFCCVVKKDAAQTKGMEK